MIHVIVDEQRLAIAQAQLAEECRSLAATLDEIDKYNAEVTESNKNIKKQANEHCKLCIAIQGWYAEVQPGLSLFEVLFTPGHLDDDIRSELSLKFEKFSGVELNGAAASDYAVSEIKSNRAVGCLVAPSHDGQVSVGAKQLHRIGKTTRVREFLRDAADLGEFDEAAFMTHARLVFPRLVFYDDLDVEIRTLPQRFTQGMRPKLTKALAALNDVLPTLLANGVHSSVVGKVFEATTGFPISIESGRTRSRQQLMRLRDVTQGDQTYRCEWHLKLEAQEGRIHFYFGPLLDGQAAGKLFIGKFCKHLAT